MSVSGDLARQEDVVGRLRELHDVADDADRPRAALLLGLAIADLVAGMPDDPARRGEFAAEGLARLAESTDNSAAAMAARDRLRGCLPAAAAEEPAHEAESIPLIGGDLNWDVDWGMLQGPAEAARNVITMLPFLASILPPTGSMRQALTSIVEVINAFDQGHWSPERDAALARAIAQVEAGGLGTGLAVMLRTVAMMIRVRRGQEAERAGGPPNWPTLAELDALIADMESADDLSDSLGAPFQALDGIHHLYLVAVVMMRIMVDVRRQDVQRDRAWRDNLLRLLDRADDHLRQLPSAWAGQAQVMRGKLAGMFAALSQATMPPEAPPSPTRAQAPRPSSPPQPRAAPPPAAAAQPSAAAPLLAAATPRSAAAPPAAAPRFDPAMGQFSQRVLQGMQILVDQAGGPVSKGLAAMFLAMDATNARKWTPEYDARLAELEREADQLAAEDQSPTGRATVAAMLATVHAVRAHQRSRSPKPADHPSAGDYAALVAEIESALDRLAQSGPVLTDLMTGGLASMLHAEAAMLLVDLSRLDVPRRAELLARARAHYGQLPAELLDQMPLFREMSVLEQLIEGVVPPDDESVRSVIERNPSVWDENGGDLRRAMLAATKARQSRAARGPRHRAQRPADGLDRAARGQPDPRPGADLDGRDAKHPGRADRPAARRRRGRHRDRSDSRGHRARRGTRRGANAGHHVLGDAGQRAARGAVPRSGGGAARRPRGRQRGRPGAAIGHTHRDRRRDRDARGRRRRRGPALQLPAGHCGCRTAPAGTGADRPVVRHGPGPVHVGHDARELPERRRIGAPGAPVD